MYFLQLSSLLYVSVLQTKLCNTLTLFKRNAKRLYQESKTLNVIALFFCKLAHKGRAVAQWWNAGLNIKGCVFEPNQRQSVVSLSKT